MKLIYSPFLPKSVLPLLLIGSGVFLAAGPALMGAETAAAETPAPQKSGEQAPEAAPSAPEIIETKHTITIDGKTIAYTAKAGKIALKDIKGEPTAEIFFIAYTKDGADPETRPVTFSFNGGPGSSSVWLHLGILGPRRVLLDDDGFALPPPHRLVDNEWSLLDETDLVFIDPVSTGYSRATDPEKAKAFHGLDEDVESVGEFIRRYTTEYERWASPKFLIGESYGTTRAAALSLFLHDRHGLYLNGIMLVSSVLDFATLRFNEDNDLPFVLFLPSLAATAHYHGQLDKDWQALPVEDVLRRAEAFATGPYRAALFAGDGLDSATFRSVAGELSAMTGIDKDTILEYKLRLDAFAFFRLLLKDEGLQVGRFDGRYTGVAPEEWESGWGPGNYDPSYNQIYGAYSATLNDYVRRDLKYKSDLPYEILTNVRPWNFSEEFSTRYVNVSSRLRKALVMNPDMRVHISSGIYDLATPYFATEYTLDRIFVHPDLKDNFEVSLYAGGHMMYSVKAELAKQKADLAGFIRRSIGQ
jgi:carboxypeptidase C (cathepsin A)